MKRAYTPPVVEELQIISRSCASLLATLSAEGNVLDFEAGDSSNLMEDDWE